MINADLLSEIRGKFAHVDACPFNGPRVFFENAGGALTLNSVVETSARFAAIPDNQGRANVASLALVDIIKEAKAAASDWFNVTDGQVIVGESGTELLFRLIRTSIAGTDGGVLIGSTVEHPASCSAMSYWADKLGRDYCRVPHDDTLGLVTAEAYAKVITADTKVATILHTSPVTGMAMDLNAICAAIRAVAPECFIIVDGIQHASHGLVDLEAAGVDGYVVSPYKVFSRHGYGVAWVSDRLTALGPENLINGPEANWEFGTRDTGAYATFHDVVDYFDWLGGQVGSSETRRGRIEDAGAAIKIQEKALTDAMLHGTGNLKGLAEMKDVTIVGGVDNPAREGLVCFWAETVPAAEIVAALNAEGIRTHVRKADHYSGNILNPLGQSAAVRVSMCHYNSEAEVARFLGVIAQVLDED
ncbi:aminotransferase class V-fold PLP-dependent enzyme [Octadecabacter sp. CECT 8868]|uniref:aminotransferase class V-fold PLP-dependent enzyme n=1 Tax=Octadecabacter algicola TaxID=2909342 RepID=UPI001F36BA9C|nr:aminotransferase class V-fold PLP-dependent enzyme [Octadecabacter algicola]MCF2905934.1 aminotransferase class V-fold PLP-dependent enzyme [Octadecabacter algicola]